MLLEVCDVLYCENIFIIIFIIIINIRNPKRRDIFILPCELKRRNMYRSRRGSDIGHVGEIGFQNKAPPGRDE